MKASRTRGEVRTVSSSRFITWPMTAPDSVSNSTFTSRIPTQASSFGVIRIRILGKDEFQPSYRNGGIGDSIVVHATFELDEDDPEALIEALKDEMLMAAAALEFERAADLRDQIAELRHGSEAP